MGRGEKKKKKKKRKKKKKEEERGRERESMRLDGIVMRRRRRRKKDDRHGLGERMQVQIEVPFQIVDCDMISQLILLKNDSSG